MSAAAREVDFGPDPRARARKAVLAASLGNALEWFDIIVYAFMAPGHQQALLPRAR